MSETKGNRAARRERDSRRKWNRRRSTWFMALLAGFFTVGCLLFLRPVHSDVEKRNLASFPSFSLEALLDGSYGEGIVTWYGDTFPGRETMISAQSRIKELYGIRGQEVHGGAVKGDEIPEIGTRPAAPIQLALPEETKENGAEPAPGQTGTDLAQGETTGAEIATENGIPSGIAEGQSMTPAETESAPEETAAPESPKGNGTIFEIDETVDSLYIADHRAFEIYGFSRAGAEAYASMLNTVKYLVGSEVEVYDMIIPSSFGVCLAPEIQEGLEASDQRSGIAYTNSMIDTSVHVIEMMDTMVEHNDEYIYFSTDLHWTTLGAYYAYRNFCQSKCFTPNTLDQFETMEFPGFLGSYYSASNQSSSLASNPDTVTAYIPMGTNDEVYYDQDGTRYNWFVVSDVSDYSAGNKYSCFIGGDQPLVEIHNPAIQDGSACLIIKESYGNAFVPFLVDHYQDIYVVDYRYYQGENLLDFTREKGIDDVIYLNYVDAVLESRSEKMLSLWQ